VGLLILFGPEVRAFLHSGLAARLASRARVSVITTHPNSQAFLALERGAVFAAPREMPAHSLTRFRGWNRRLHDAWMKAQGQERWRQQSQGPRRNETSLRSESSAAHKRLPSWLRAAHRLEATLARLSFDGKGWERLLEQLGLDCLVAADYASPGAATALLAAARKSVATVVLTNSWKDVYSHPFVNARPDWIGVAGQPEADHLARTSPHLTRNRIVVAGSLHLERFLRPGGIPGRAEFCGKAGLEEARPFVCYTAASPRVVAGEGEIVRVLLEAAERHKARPQVLLRLNPREDGARFRPLQARFSSCVVQTPRWEWDAASDWNAPLRGDLDTWVATVHHAAFNVSIPSTVTLEFAAMGRLTLNVCFDAERRPPEASNARFWDAPFYRHVRDSPLVAGAFSAPEFRKMLERWWSEADDGRPAPASRIVSPVDEGERLVWSAIAGARETDAARAVRHSGVRFGMDRD
jgi:hypothetical protein